MPDTTWTDLTTGDTNVVGQPVDAATVAATGSPARRALADRFAEEIHLFDFIPAARHNAILARTSTYDCASDFAAAIAAAQSAGGACIRIPRGTLMTEGQIALPNTVPVTLVGDGMNATIIKAAAVMDQMLFHDDYYVVGGGARDLTLNGNKLAARNMRLIAGNQMRLERIGFDNATLYNIHLGAASNGVNTTFLFEMMMSFCKSRNEEALFTNPADLPLYNYFLEGWSSDNQTSDCVFSNAKTANVYDAGTVPNLYSRIHVFGYPNTHRPQYGIWSKGGSVISECYTDNTSVSGYYLDGDDISVVGSIAYWPAGSESGNGITLAAGADRCAVIGNVVHSLAGANKVVQNGTAGVDCTIIGNPGASYTTIGAQNFTGNVTVGSAAAISGIGAVRHQVAGTGFSSAAALQVQYSADTAGPFDMLGKSRGAAVGTNGVVQAGDILGHRAWYGDGGSGMVPAAHIRAVVDGTPGPGDMPARLVFATTADGASFSTDRVELLSTGALRPVTNNLVPLGDSSHRWLGAYTVILDVSGAASFGGNVGFYGTAPQAKPSVTGSRGGNAALASLITGLATLGLITDSTTA